MKIECLEIYKNRDSIEAQEKWSTLNGGQKEVVKSYIYQDRENALVDLLVIDHAWSDHMQEIINYLSALGINQFVFSDTSTECFKSIQILLNNGCKLSNINYKYEHELFSGSDKLISGILVEI